MNQENAAGKRPAHDTCEVISVHSMEQQETHEEDESEAGDDHSAQRETVAAFSLNDLGGNHKVKLESIKRFPHFQRWRSHLLSRLEPASPSPPSPHLSPGPMWHILQTYV